MLPNDLTRPDSPDFQNVINSLWKSRYDSLQGEEGCQLTKQTWLSPRVWGRPSVPFSSCFPVQALTSRGTPLASHPGPSSLHAGSGGPELLD